MQLNRRETHTVRGTAGAPQHKPADCSRMLRRAGIKWRGDNKHSCLQTTRNTSLMTAVAAVTAFPMEKVLRRGCAVLYAEITSTIACNSVSFVVVVFFFFFFFFGGVEVVGGGDVSVCLGFTRLTVNHLRTEQWAHPIYKTSTSWKQNKNNKIDCVFAENWCFDEISSFTKIRGINCSLIYCERTSQRYYTLWCSQLENQMWCKQCTLVMVDIDATSKQNAGIY